MSNSQKLKSRIKNGSQVTLNLSSNVVGGSNFQHKLLLTDTQASSLFKSFTNKSSVYLKLSKTHLSKMVQLGGFLGRIRDCY